MRSAGTIQVGDEPIEDLPAHKRAKTGIALVPQGRLIFPKLTVEENLRMGSPFRQLVLGKSYSEVGIGGTSVI